MPILLVLLLLAACGRVGEESSEPPESRLEPSAPAPGKRRPLHEGFTQRPPKETPGLPPPTAPLLTDVEREALEGRSLEVSAEERERAQTELVALVDEFESTEEGLALLARIRSKATE
ncbi:MAG: hypothetical protein ACRD1Z_09995, partial [Vicinamibacteria bacterium]